MLTEATGGATGTGVSHAGARAKAAAMVELTELRLRNLEPRAVDVLERLLTAESESVALGAANSLVDRSCGKARERVEVAASITVTRPFHPGVRRTPLGSSLDNSR